MASGAPAFLHPFARPAAQSGEYVSIVRGDGALVFDADGRDYVDAMASLWYCDVGHGRSEIAEAAAAQMTTLAGFHAFEKFTTPPADELAEKVASLSHHGSDARVFFTSGGSESVDSAIKLARVAHAQRGEPQRTLIVSRRPSYHGVTIGATALTGLAPNQEHFGPLLGDALQVPHDDLAAVEAIVETQGDRLAAIIAEPVIGAGGVFPPAPGYLEGLRALADRAGAWLILDEVICGFGRLGSWFGSQRYGVRPDLQTFAKAITSGYIPLGGVILGPEVAAALESDSDFVLRHGFTYSGHPTACAAGLANLAIMEREGLVERAIPIGERLAKGLAELVDGERVTELRGDGAVWALGLGADLSAPRLRDAILEAGVIPRPIGTATLSFCPPLVTTEDQIDRIVEATRTGIAATR